MSDLQAAIAAIWERSRPLMRDRLDQIDRAAAELRAGALADATRDEAVRAAHQLAGSLGSFGMPEGSELARALEDRLRPDRPPALDAGAVADLTARLHGVLDPRLGDGGGT